MSDSRNVTETADVIVVGAGPAGSAAAYHLARHGRDVLLLEKSEFPREKVCGDGLTPRSVRHLIRMGIDIDAPGWHRTRGVRFFSHNTRVEVDFRENTRYPGFGLSRSRHDFDEILARHAAEAGARLRTGTQVTEPLLDRAGRVRGVTARASGERTDYAAPLVIAADGVSARLALALGVRRLPNRPMATAIRRYHRSPAGHDDPYFSIWGDLDVRPGGPPLPGYGWIFPMGDGRVNVGLGLVHGAPSGSTDTRRLLDDWMPRTPREWGLDDPASIEGPVRGAALPMGFNRLPHYTRGLLLVGDSGGMVSPWAGEGIAYAMEAGELAADVAVTALARPAGPSRESALQRYPREIHQRLGRYYRLGNLWAALLSRPRFTSFLSRRLITSPPVARVLTQLITNTTDDGREAADRLINALVRAVPSRAPR
ncbi:geranylgeranyl reductase family protein [Streptomyces mayteni]